MMVLGWVARSWWWVVGRGRWVERWKVCPYLWSLLRSPRLIHAGSNASERDHATGKDRRSKRTLVVHQVVRRSSDADTGNEADEGIRRNGRNN